jgi:predicted transcriptional regulator
VAPKTIGEQELALLRFLADSGGATVGEAAERFGEPRGLARSTVLTMMERLRRKGHLGRRSVDGVFRYQARQSSAELLRGAVQRFVQNNLGGSVAPFVAYLTDAPDLTADPNVQARRAELVQQAQVTLAAIAAIADRDVGDPYIDPGTLARAVQVGILDAPQLRHNRFAPGAITSRYTAGACIAVDSAGRPWPEQDRLAHFLKGH